MTRLILTALFVSRMAVVPEDPSLAQVRVLYTQSASDEQSCLQLIELLKPYSDKNNPLLAGYAAGATMMMAKHCFFPYSKLSYFRKGRSMLQKAVDTDSANVELRFLRFGLQTNSPGFLGYHDQITTDKKYLLASLGRLSDMDLKRAILLYLKNSDYVTNQEKQKLELQRI